MFFISKKNQKMAFYIFKFNNSYLFVIVSLFFDP